MSGDAALLPCPVCAHAAVFHSAEALRDRLIQVSANKLLCPVCQEEIAGLDKLTIHLFSHVKILPKKVTEANVKDSETKLIPKSDNQSTQQKKSKAVTAKNKSSQPTTNAPVKFVKIYPKLPVITLNTVPVIDISRSPVDECLKSGEMLIKTETSVLPTNTTCNLCGLQFVDANILRMHRGLIHNIDDNTSQTFTRYNCHLCPKNFKMRGSLMVHLRVAHYGFLSGSSDSAINMYKNGKIESSNKSSTDKLQILEGHNKQWQCDVCQKCFTTKYFLKKHKRLHTGETPYACAQCNKTFTFQQSYHKHLLYHNDEKPHVCNFCGRAFKELSTLHNHQRIHTGEKPFACETCGKCFRQRVSYLVHRRIHTGVMPYKCTACEKSFRYKVSQRTHKCLAQPPGTVVRQTGDLIEKLKKKHATNDQLPMTDNRNPGHETKYLEVSEANAELVRRGAKISLEDMESENFTLLADSFNENFVEHAYDSTSSNCLANCMLNDSLEMEKCPNINSDIDKLTGDRLSTEEKSVPSPSEIFKHLCLSKEEDFKQLMHNDLNEKLFDIDKDFNDFL